MKFVIFGLTLSSSWGNGHATIWRGLCRGLFQCGHTVTFFERDVPYYSEHRDLNELAGGKLILFSEWSDIISLAGQELAEADVAIITSYCPDSLAATELVLSSTVPLKVFYDLDTPVTLARLKMGQSVSYIGSRGLQDFDLVLSFTGGRALIELETELGAQATAPLYGSVDPERHRPVGSHAAYRSDLSYLGTYAADRQEALERLFVLPARQMSSSRFVIGGAQYPQEFPWAENIFFVRHLEPALHPAFFCSSRLTLNVTRAAMKEMGYCPSGRLFEAAACGAPIITDDWAGLDSFFEPGQEIIVVRDEKEVVTALQLSDSELQRYSAQARERVLSEHTALRRAQELEFIVEDAFSQKPNGSQRTIQPAGER